MREQSQRARVAPGPGVDPQAHQPGLPPDAPVGEPLPKTRRPTLLDHLRRKTTSGRFIPEIDSLRFFAIAMVVVFHLAAFVGDNDRQAGVPNAGHGWFYHVAGYGHYGVQLFFMISGFVLALPFANRWLRGGHPVELRAYFLRRLTRLEPPYILVMVGFAAILAVRHRYPGPEIATHLAASLVYLHNVIYSNGSLINNVAWSLEIEVQFYCLAPLLGLVYRIERAAVRRAIIVAMIGVAALVLTPLAEGRLRLTLLGFLQFFLVGFLVADLYLTVWQERPRAPWWWRLPQAVLRNPWIATIGGMCYTIYLLHYPLISFVGHPTLAIAQRTTPHLHLAVQALLILPVLLIVSSVYFVLVERPCMDRRWPEKLRARLFGAPGAGDREPRRTSQPPTSS